MIHFLEAVKKIEILSPHDTRKMRDLKKTHAAFSGVPKKHPYDSELIVLLADPNSSDPFYYEFRSQDVAFIEELPKVVDLEGDTVDMVRLWVERGSIGIRSTPFIVENF